ncbi:MAG: sterol desaturase family protein [Chlorobiota bacterium]|nr:sterol desaturase family protein [Chlorobiota bacterium]QQS67609.1 MAG: sterol desaturase family protein [Chlorobiota bacterium]
METYINIISASYKNYSQYLINEILNPSWSNYFYWLILISIITWLIEVMNPWRKEQNKIRTDFWLDGFYMFFNFFLFSLIGFNAISDIAVNIWNNILSSFGLQNLVAIKLFNTPKWFQLLIMFILTDFIQWNIHRLLHKNKFLWEFHKVHHSVMEMGFSAHLRYHWFETIIYKGLQFIPLSMIGFGLSDFIIIHIIALAIGHLNHSNINLSYGPLKYILNNPKMHIWHHAKFLPNLKNGINFGISLSIWDYIFKTNYIPYDGRDIELGFDGVEDYPKTFINQSISPFKKK